MGQILDISITELKTFIGVLITMGFHQLPSIRLYWSTDPNFGEGKIKAVMLSKRFFKIIGFIHLNDNSIMSQWLNTRVSKCG